MEELKLIMETISQLGTEARILFIWWLACNLFYKCLWVAVVSGTLWGSYKFGTMAYKQHAFLERIARLFDYWLPLNRQEKDKISIHCIPSP